MEASEKKQIIVHASMQQEDLDRLTWVCEDQGMNRSEAIREGIELLYQQTRRAAIEDLGLSDG